MRRMLMTMASAVMLLACSAAPGATLYQTGATATASSDEFYVVAAAPIVLLNYTLPDPIEPQAMPAPSSRDLVETANPIEARMATRLRPAVERYDEIMTRTGVKYHMRI